MNAEHTSEELPNPDAGVPVGFSVDTHIFRELGELLVGRDSTALAELVKNAYDADATTVTISGLNLSDPKDAVIRVIDDGNGMTRQIFQEGFLRIAGREKERGDRRSARYKRRFTGEKGIGRLAAHKLAKNMHLASVPFAGLYPNAKSLEATIDWDLIEKATTLDQTSANGGVILAERDALEEVSHGTWIELTRLRRRWSEAQRQRLYAELSDFLVPEPLLTVDAKLYPGPRLIERLPVRDEGSEAKPFRLNLADDFDVGESFWAALFDQNAWLVEIDAATSPGRVLTRLSPSRVLKEKYPQAAQVSFQTDAAPLDGLRPKFHARIIVREGQLRADGARKSFAQNLYGVRIYVEGFRVAPYGEPGNDWLHLDAEYTRRSRLTGDEAAPDAGLSSPYNRLVFGAVLFTQDSSRPLRMLVNREGFVDDVAFDYVRDTVQQAINQYVRHTAAVRQSQRLGRDLFGATRLDSFEVPFAAAQKMRSVAMGAREGAAKAVEFANQGMTRDATRAIESAAQALIDSAGKANDLFSEVAQTRILAAVGLQMGAFIHEVRGVQLFASALRDDVKRELEERRIDYRQVLIQVGKRLSDLSQMLERQSSFLSDAISVDARRRRSPQVLIDKVRSAVQLVTPEIARRGIRFEADIAADIKTAPMFGAELTLILSNLLTNAVKAAGRGGRISCSASRTEGNVKLLMANTGARVNLQDSERWFLPFESTTSNPEPNLGVGMGLGLPITRDMLTQYGGSIRFVPPEPPFATAVEVTIPSR